ncbi:MAG TPA: hypothetical protein VHS58_06575, partial [Acetobacteraceae bacterium]|nr:hypothetical protein [Acetobacteraceae bacterium]
LKTIRSEDLEARALETLRTRLMDPALFKEFAEAFVEEWNRLQGNTDAENRARAAERQRTEQQIERLVDALANGTPAAVVNDRLLKLEERRAVLAREISEAKAPAPRLFGELLFILS